MNFARAIIIAMLIILISSTGAFAIQSADFLYTESDLGGGWWQYDYTLYNTSPISDAGYNIYYVEVYYDSSLSFVGLALPADWEGMGSSGEWTDWGGSAPAYSTATGIPPVNVHPVAPGDSLSGFSFKIDSQVGSIPFDVLFENPIDPDNPVLISSYSNVAPEPTNILFVTIGFATLAGYGWLRKVRQHKDNRC